MLLRVFRSYPSCQEPLQDAERRRYVNARMAWHGMAWHGHGTIEWNGCCMVVVLWCLYTVVA